MSGPCPCGGFTLHRKARHGSATLYWRRCGACGRCGGFVLIRPPDLILCGEPARQTFSDLRRLSHD